MPPINFSLLEASIVMSHRAICVHVLVCVVLLVLILLGANQIPQDGVVLNLDHILYDFLFLNTIF
jgi:hypothetical protein